MSINKTPLIAAVAAVLGSSVQFGGIALFDSAARAKVPLLERVVVNGRRLAAAPVSEQVAVVGTGVRSG